MTYNIQLEQKVSYKLFLAGLSLSSYAANAVYQVGTATGNLSLSVASGVITLPAGRYMLRVNRMKSNLHFNSMMAHHIIILV